MQPILVLFDIDGTLIDTFGAGRRSLEHAFRHVFGVDGIATLAAEVRFEGKTDPILIAEMARAAGVDESHVAERGEEMTEAYLAALREEMSRHDPRRRLRPGVEPLLRNLHPRSNVYLGLLTGNIEHGARLKLEAFGIHSYFRAGGFSSDHPLRSEIARIAREKMTAACGVAFEVGRVFVIGDTDHDVLCAKANGFRSIAVPSGWVSAERIAAAGPDVVLPDLADLSCVLAALGLA
jgi:phosphoglycolate phosphatase-like HAD superfamily hydrolase